MVKHIINPIKTGGSDICTRFFLTLTVLSYLKIINSLQFVRKIAKPTKSFQCSSFIKLMVIEVTYFEYV